MEVIIQTSKLTASHLAARYLKKRIEKKPDLSLGLPSGQTPLLLYKELIRMHRDEGLDFSGVTLFLLDEFVGINASHPASHRGMLKSNLLDHVNIDPGRVVCPDVSGKDLHGAAEAYEQAIREAGGIDLQVLGIGPAGHLGFNEPMSSLGSRTRSKTLSPRTRQDFAADFGGEGLVPSYMMTMGIGTLLEAKEINLLAFGREKAEVLAQSIEGPVASIMPASALQLHPVVKIFLDQEAASGLRHAAYYTWVYSRKPEQQKF
ncbi:MAG TPA: glucosamine-6-phosphate deaminase [Kiritimatiellia bacterium]|nr:glucosamine-6-phosphate deaminase [Kiritimatiellia bacterium]